jgi:hypothetical protein
MALAGQAVEPRGRGRRDLHELAEPHAAPAHHGVEHQRQAHLQPRHAIGDGGEWGIGPGGELAGFVEAVGGVIGGDDLQIAPRQRGPERLLIRHGALGGRAHPLRALDAGAVEHLFGLEKVMGAGLGPDRRAAGAGGGDLGHGLGGGDVEDHNRGLGLFGEAAHAGDGLDLGAAGAGGGVVDGTCAPLGQ